MGDKEGTTIRSTAPCPVMAKWRCCCITEGTIFATRPDCSAVISATDIHTHGYPKTDIWWDRRERKEEEQER